LQATTNAAEVKKLQAGDLEIKEAKAVAAVRNRLEMDGLRTEENNAVLQVRSSLILSFQTQNQEQTCVKNKKK
jgi:hypothetical protein